MATAGQSARVCICTTSEQASTVNRAVQLCVSTTPIRNSHALDINDTGTCIERNESSACHSYQAIEGSFELHDCSRSNMLNFICVSSCTSLGVHCTHSRTTAHNIVHRTTMQSTTVNMPSRVLPSFMLCIHTHCLAGLIAQGAPGQGSATVCTPRLRFVTSSSPERYVRGRFTVALLSASAGPPSAITATAGPRCALPLHSSHACNLLCVRSCMCAP
jgi:hypothetical protein